MSQKIAPYWVGNVALLHIPHNYFRTGPAGTECEYGATPTVKPLAQFLPLIPAPKKDAAKP